MRRPLLTVTSALALLLGLCGCAGTGDPTGSSEFPESARCRTVQTPVAIPRHPVHGRVVGDYCVPRNHRGVLMILVAGANENANYWSLPSTSGKRSLVRAAYRRGFATLAIDRLGTGRSTRPTDSRTVTYDAQVATVTQVVRSYHRMWRTVIGVGHSLGSGTLLGVAARHPDAVDALALTGYGDTVSADALRQETRYAVPARTLTDTWRSLDSGYRGVRPEGLSRIRFYRPAVTPAALKNVAARLGTKSMTEVRTRPRRSTARAYASRVRVPTLLLDGRHDSHYCLTSPSTSQEKVNERCSSRSAFRSYGRALFPHARLSTRLLPRTGHTIEWEVHAPAAHRALLKWAEKSAD
jgi:pimeloyl-ACP methyl ester carboxylesterase